MRVSAQVVPDGAGKLLRVRKDLGAGQVKAERGPEAFALERHGHQAVSRPIPEGVRNEPKDVLGALDGEVFWRSHASSFGAPEAAA